MASQTIPMSMIVRNMFSDNMYEPIAGAPRNTQLPMASQSGSPQNTPAPTPITSPITSPRSPRSPTTSPPLRRMYRPSREDYIPSAPPKPRIPFECRSDRKDIRQETEKETRARWKREEEEHQIKLNAKYGCAYPCYDAYCMRHNPDPYLEYSDNDSD